ncbi:MAG: Ig-like domain-containing protein [Anaerolineaceae bacterium]
MFSVVHHKGVVKSFSIFLIIVMITSMLPQRGVMAEPVNQIDSPPNQLEIVEGDHIELVTLAGKPISFDLHVKTPQEGAFFVWEVAEPAADGSIDIAEANLQASITYLPAEGFSGTDRFAIRVSDMQGKMNRIGFHVLIEDKADFVDLDEPLTLARDLRAPSNQLNHETVDQPMTVNKPLVEPAEDRPTLRIAQGESLNIRLDGEAIKRVTLNAIGGEAVGLTWRIAESPFQGEVFLNPAGGAVEVIYKPADDFREMDSLKVAVVGSDGQTAESRLVFLEVQKVPEAVEIPLRPERATLDLEFAKPNEATGPYISVQKYQWGLGIVGSGWEPYESVTLTNGDCVLPNSADSNGTVYFDGYQYECTLNFDVGSLVTLQGTSVTKSHTILNLGVKSFDPTTRTVTGWAEDRQLAVTLDPWGYPEEQSVDATNGEWVASFTIQIPRGTSLLIKQADLEGSETLIEATLNMPNIEARPQAKQVYGSGWPENAALTITIGTFQDNLTVGWGGSFSYYSSVELTPGTTISVTDGVITKSMTVADIAINSVDDNTETVSGTSTSSSFFLEKNNASTEMITPDGNGNWSFIYPALEPGDIGTAYSEEADYDRTTYYWNVPNPSFTVHPYNDYIEGSGWPAYGEVTAAFEGYPDVRWSSQANGVGELRFDSYSHPEFDIKLGQSISLTCGSWVREHTVINLRLTNFNLAENSISGTANPGDVFVFLDGSGDGAIATADESGNWSTPLTGQLAKGTKGFFFQYDDKWNSTYNRWEIPNPMLVIDKSNGSTIRGTGWPDDLPKTIFVNNAQVAVINDNSSYFYYYPEDPLPAGTVVRVESGSYVKEHTVIDLRMTGYNLASNSISGVANTGALTVDRWDNSESVPTTAPDGQWTAIFDAVLVSGSYGQLMQADAEGDKTYSKWEIPNPMVVIDKSNGSTVRGTGWPDDLPKTIFVNNVQVAVIENNSSSFTYDSPDLLPKDTLIRVESGDYFKEHTVIDLQMTDYNLTANSISGLANNGSLTVDRWDTSESIPATAIEGQWTAIFGNPLVKGAYGLLSQSDEDGDTTQVTWEVETQSIFLPLIQR